MSCPCGKGFTPDRKCFVCQAPKCKRCANHCCPPPVKPEEPDDQVWQIFCTLYRETIGIFGSLELAETFQNDHDPDGNYEIIPYTLNPSAPPDWVS